MIFIVKISFLGNLLENLVLGSRIITIRVFAKIPLMIKNKGDDLKKNMCYLYLKSEQKN